MEELLNLIVNYCERNDITAYKIGKHTGLAQSGVKKILTGKYSDPRPKTLYKIKDYLASEYPEFASMLQDISYSENIDQSKESSTGSYHQTVQLIDDLEQEERITAKEASTIKGTLLRLILRN